MSLIVTRGQIFTQPRLSYKAMRSGNIFEVRCIFGKIGPTTQKFGSRISSRFLFWTSLPTGVPFRNPKNGPKIFAKIRFKTPVQHFWNALQNMDFLTAASCPQNSFYTHIHPQNVQQTFVQQAKKNWKGCPIQQLQTDFSSFKPIFSYFLNSHFLGIQHVSAFSILIILAHFYILSQCLAFSQHKA